MSLTHDHDTCFIIFFFFWFFNFENKLINFKLLTEVKIYYIFGYFFFFFFFFFKL